MSLGAACVPWRLRLARPLHHEGISFMVQIACDEGIAHESDSGMLEQSVYTIKLGVFKLRVTCCERAVGWEYVEVVIACCTVVFHVGCCGPHD